jgi:hypothetical protein
MNSTWWTVAQQSLQQLHPTCMGHLLWLKAEAAAVSNGCPNYTVADCQQLFWICSTLLLPHEYSSGQPPPAAAAAAASEIKQYLNHCADKYSLKPHLRLSTRVTGAVLDEPSGSWTLTTSSGEQHVARVLVLAAGEFSSLYVVPFGVGRDGWWRCDCCGYYWTACYCKCAGHFAALLHVAQGRGRCNKAH